MTLPLLPEHIVDLFVWIDARIPRRFPNRNGGRLSLLTDSEIITILLWSTIALRQATVKDIHRFASLHLRPEFPELPTYRTFLDHCHRVMPMMTTTLAELLATDAPLRFMDSTMLPVCTRFRGNAHRVAKGFASWGKNHQGWHFGFKLHASVSPKGQLCRFSFSPANAHDGTYAERLVDAKTIIAVGDGSYTGALLRQSLWERFGTFVLAPPHPAHRTIVTAPWQDALLSMRSKIESVFDVLKEHLLPVTSFPRSVFGYFVHYIRVLFAYQIIALSSGA